VCSSDLSLVLPFENLYAGPISQGAIHWKSAVWLYATEQEFPKSFSPKCRVIRNMAGVSITKKIGLGQGRGGIILGFILSMLWPSILP
jgi:hypothetical protein